MELEMNGTSTSTDETYRDFLIHIEGNDGALTPCTDDAARALIAAPFRPTWHASQRGIVQTMRDRIDDIWEQVAK